MKNKMSPSYLLRAMQPIRSATMRSTSLLSTQAPAALQYSRTALLSRRLNSTLVEENSQQQELKQEPQEQPQKVSQPKPPKLIIPPSAVPNSLRSYPYSTKSGTVVSVGRMDRTVRVDHRHNIWDNHLRKKFPTVTTYMVSDPQNSLREGDVIEFSSGFRKSRRVRHVVERIIAPFGEAIEDRPAVLTREEREAIRVEKRAAKAARREQRRQESDNVSPHPLKQGNEHIGRIRSLVLQRVAAANSGAGVST
ncbi:hypothetical protein BDV12DRAFT_170792 [Aspergillus spectabilis]